MPNLIPSDTQFILIISDSVKRLGDLPQYDYHSHCSRILGWLQDYLTVRYRNATVVVKRGGRLFVLQNNFILHRKVVIHVSKSSKF